MAVRLRLKRMGAKKAPRYRIVAADARSPRDGRDIEVVGNVNPTTEPAEDSTNDGTQEDPASNAADMTQMQDILPEEEIE